MTDQQKCLQAPIPVEDRCGVAFGGHTCNLEKGHAGEWHFADIAPRAIKRFGHLVRTFETTNAVTEDD